MFGPPDGTVDPFWPSMQILKPPEQQPVDDDVWARMQATDDPHVLLPDIVLPGMRVPYGDAVAVKIMEENPDDEDEDKCVGGVYLLDREAGQQLVSDLLGIVSQLRVADNRVGIDCRSPVRPGAFGRG